MKNRDTSDEEAVEPEAGDVQGLIPKGRRSFSRMRRELTDEELGSPAMQRVLMDDLDRLEAECTSLRSFETKFHDKDKVAAIQEEKLKLKVSSDIFFGVLLTVGGGLLGYAPNFDSEPLTAIVCALLGAVLLVGGIVAKGVLR